LKTIEYRAEELEIDLQFVDEGVKNEEEDVKIPAEINYAMPGDKAKISSIVLTNTSCLGIMFLRFKVR
jgi:hypothetical protein